MKKKYWIIILLLVVISLTTVIYIAYENLFYLPKDLLGTITTVNRQGDLIIINIIKGNKKITRLYASDKLYFSHPNILDKNNIIVEGLNLIKLENVLYKYNLKHDRLEKLDSINHIDVNDLYPSISHNKNYLALFCKQKLNGIDEVGSYKILDMTSRKLVTSIKVDGMPLRSSWGINDSSLFVSAYINKKPYIIKLFLFNDRIDTICTGINPVLSPDGKNIAYINNGEIYVCDTLGKNNKVVFNNKSIVKPFPTTTISWSPENNYLAFLGEISFFRLYPTFNLYIVDVNKINKWHTVIYNVDIDCDWR